MANVGVSTLTDLVAFVNFVRPVELCTSFVGLVDFVGLASFVFGQFCRLCQLMWVLLVQSSSSVFGLFFCSVLVGFLSFVGFVGLSNVVGICVFVLASSVPSVSRRLRRFGRWLAGLGLTFWSSLEPRPRLLVSFSREKWCIVLFCLDFFCSSGSVQAAAVLLPEDDEPSSLLLRRQGQQGAAAHRFPSRGIGGLPREF